MVSSRVSLAVGVFLLGSILAFGQSSALNGEIEGTITDQSGGVVAKVKVSITNDGTGYQRSTETNESGLFRFNVLPLGAYTLTADAAGFASEKLSGIVINAGSTRTENINLYLASTQRDIVVTGEAPVVEPGRTDIGTTVSGNSIANIALVSRNPYNFILIQPNVSGTPNVEFGVPRKVNANGFVDRINYQIDGGNNTQSDRAGIRLTPFSNTYVAEVQQVNNGFSPEFGNTTGTVFNAITKSGSNQFHGEAAYLFRRTDMTARFSTLAASQTKPNQNVDDEFVNAGGPVIKDKLFFFGAWEHVKRDLPAAVTVTPATIATLGLPASFAGAIPFGQNVTFVLGKADYQMNQNNRLSGRYSYFRNESPYNGAGGLTLESQTYLFKDRAPAVFLQFVSILSPSVVNEFRFNIPKRYQRQVTFDGTGAPPTINITGVANFGASTNTGLVFTETTPEWSDNLSYQRSNHSYKFGGDFRYIKDNQTSPTFARYTFPSIAAYQSALSGANTKSYTTYSQAFGNPVFEYSSLFTGLYVQDNWKVRPNFTLNYGVRYDVYKIPAGLAGAPVVTSQNFTVDKNNFAPRIGLAYALGADQKTVVRMNAGIFYDAPQTNVYYNALLNSGQPQFFTMNAPATAAYAPAFPNVLSAVPTGFSLPTQDVTTVSPDFRNLYSENLNVQITRAITPAIGVSVSYLYTKGTHIPVISNINLIASGQFLADGRPIYGSGRVDPRFNNILMANSVGNSNYNGLNVSVNRRFAAGYEFFASYTWSHAIDDAPEANVLDSGALLLEDPSNRGRDHGNGFADRRHAFNLSGVIEPKFGSGHGLGYIANHNRLSFLFVARSGDPFNITGNRTLNGDSAASAVQRPLYLGRNTVVGPPVIQLDARYSRVFPIHERWKPEFFAETWNTFNHSNVTSLNTSATVDASGNITTPPSLLQTVTLDPRLIQLGFKLSF